MITVGGEYVVTATLGRAGWRTSTFSSNGVDCVDVDFTAEGTEIRHSRAPEGPVIAFTPTEWSSWLTEVVREKPSNTNGAVEVVVDGQGSWIVHSTRTAEQIQFSHGEVEAFRHGVLVGEFDRDAMLNNAGLLAHAS